MKSSELYRSLVRMCVMVLLASVVVACSENGTFAEFHAGAVSVDVTPTTLPVIVNGGMLSQTGVAPKCRTLVVLNFSGYTEAQRSVQWPRRQPAGSVLRVGNIAMR